MISADEAKAIILNHTRATGPITVGLERALQLTLATDIIATENVPAFDNSHMDGYAVRSADVQSVPVTLRINGEIPAGSSALQPLGSGEAMRIMTGAKIPRNCDAVVQQEWTEDAGNGAIVILRNVPSGHNVRTAGADIVPGTTVMACGRTLRPQELGVLASLGCEFVEVYRPPSVAILPTGDEITPLGKPLRDGSVRNSNAYSLSALVREAGAGPVTLEIAKDEKESIRNNIETGLREDVLITTGGVSVGKYDLVREVMEELGVQIHFWKVNIKPGMPLLFGTLRGKLLFGLPGNPVSSMVTFIEFVKPALVKMMGRTPAEKPHRSAKMAHDFFKKDGKRHFLRGILEQVNGEATVRTTGSQVSNILTSLALANCIIIVPEEKELVRAGEEVEIELL